MKHRNQFLMIISCMIAMALPSLAAAQQAGQQQQPQQTNNASDSHFVVDRFEPLPGQGVNILNTATSDLIQSLQPSVGLFVHYDHEPLKYCPKAVKDGDAYKCDSPKVPIINYQVKGELTFGLGLYDYVDLGLGIPLILQKGKVGYQSDAKALDGFALGDARLMAKGRFLNPEWAGGLGAALMLTAYLPIPYPKDNPFNTFYDGKSYSSGVRFEPRLILDWRHSSGFIIGANIGYQFHRRPFTYNGWEGKSAALTWNAGTRVPLGLDWLNLIGTFFGEYQFNRDLKEIKVSKKGYFNTPVEYTAALEFKLPYDLVAQVGGGGALWTRHIGVPKFRLFAGLAYTPIGADMDGDGIPDKRDQCPEDPEDKDGFNDYDGCPDPDNDEDGTLDVNDKCPDVKGDTQNQGCPWGDRDSDGIMDNEDSCPDDPGTRENQGCPLYDRDKDGIPDDKDRCPDEPEDKDGFQDEDGCPDTDNDNDGIPDVEDKCKFDPEDKDGFEDDDGCPDIDNDNDGIPDDRDKCPNEPETINGVKDDDGCPDKGKSKVTVTETKIEILEKVFFATNKAIIRKRSYDLLNQVAAVLKNYKNINKVRVDGYTDSRGRPSYNLKLSQDRADAVRNYLIERGIDPARLSAKGYGEADPIATNETSAGREQNRRVEFTIVELNGKPVSTNTVTIKQKEVAD